MKMKVDTAADTCIITVEDLQLLPFMLEIKPCYATLKGYGGGKIHNVGATYLKIHHCGCPRNPLHDRLQAVTATGNRQG